MGVVTVGSVRSCGATTLALGLAATWPQGRRVLLVEGDPAGGTLAAVSGWPAEPSLVSLAAAARHDGTAELVFEHCQALPGGASVLAAPASTERSRAALGMLGPLLGRLGELDADVLVDCGRLDPGSPAMSVLGRADRVLLVVRPRLADLHALATWLEAHPMSGPPAELVAIGDGPYPDAEIAGALGVEMAGVHVPWDSAAADALAVLPASARQLRLSPLVRACRSLAERLAPQSAREPATEAEPPAVKARVGMAERVKAPWRTAPVAVSANGNTPEGAEP